MGKILMIHSNVTIIMKLLGIIWGIAMVSQDLPNYNLYLLLLNVPDVTCENFVSYYAIFLLATTITSGIYYPISGWLTDRIKNIKLFFVISVIAQLILFTAQYVIIVIKFQNSVFFLIAIWLLLQMLFIQNNNLLWKIIKEDIDMLYHNELEAINKIGNMGDLISDVAE